MAFVRVSEAVEVGRIAEPFRSALEGSGAGPILERATRALRTRSTQELGWLARKLGGIAATESVAVLAAPWLVWTTDAGKGPGTLWVRLADAELEVFDGSRPIPPSPVLKDRGLRIEGLLGRAPTRTTAFLGLGPQPDAEDFVAAVLAARDVDRAP